MAKAQVGDLIRIVEIGQLKVGKYNVGDILEVMEIHTYPKSDVIITTNECYLHDHEYEIHRKAGEEDAATAPAKATLHSRETVLPKHKAEAMRDAVIAGVGPDAPVVENEHGAKQSQSPYRMDLIDAKALLKIAQVHKQGGDKYGDTNWHNIPVNDHINHALVHIYAHLAEDTSDEHLAHAATRMIFALALQLR